MAKSSFSRSRRLAVLLSIALQTALLAPVCAQELPGGSSAQTSLPGLPSSSPAASPGAMAQGQGPVIVPMDFSALRIAPGDLLSVNIYDSPDLSGSYRVDPAGKLTIPLCGQVEVQGLSLPDAASRIETALKNSQILLQPQVNVDVLQYAGQYVTVSGEVAHPGQVALIAPTLLTQILAQAGGVTSLAGAHIEIHHGTGKSASVQKIPYYRSRSNPQIASLLVRPGDSVVVPRAGIVYVLGAVNRPGGYVMQEDGKLNVAQALALSGGTLLQANTGGLRVIRRNPDGTVLDFPLSYDGIAKGTETPLALQPQDIVYVPLSKMKEAFVSATGIIQATASAAIFASY
ncbi:MAG: polysaccharide biosynthesis/export family protein [Terracidiphilus sp.]